jgi:hypothetical protein
MSKRALLTLGLVGALACAGCGGSGPKAQATPTTTVTTTTTPTTPPPSTPTSVTAQPATTAAPGLAAASPLGSTQSVTTADGRALRVRVASVTRDSATQLQVQVQLTADGPPSQVQPATDFRLVDSAGAAHGASVVAQPTGCPALPVTVSVTAQAPVTGCVVFTLASGVTPTQVTFTTTGASGAVAWKAS